jgi:hypothetical protein
MHQRAIKLLPEAATVFLEEATDFIAEQDPRRMAQILTQFLTG